MIIIIGKIILLQDIRNLNKKIMKNFSKLLLLLLITISYSNMYAQFLKNLVVISFEIPTSLEVSVVGRSLGMN